MSFGEMINLPDEIGTLACLTHLHLFRCAKLKELPDSIGGLTNLQVLDLNNSGITSLPESIFGLKKLKVIGLYEIPMIKNNPDGPTPFIWNLIHHCHSLGDIGHKVYDTNTKLYYALACNRARVRLASVMPSVWPLALQNATKLFRSYSFNETRTAFSRSKMDAYYSDSDAIYRFLVDGRESFLLSLIHCSAGH